MKNRFYNDFDSECRMQRNADEYRTPFQRDRDRIIHSSALRRLQAKTQVFHSAEYDFYRTRLTHSIEVAQIGRAICHFLKHQSEFLDGTCYIDDDLVEATCLAHDLGHPPFGHSGETTLNRMMQGYGGFEGNAQTLRLLGETIYSEAGGRIGMNPTRALVDSVMKYKTRFSQLDAPENHFIYDEQETYIDFVFQKRPFPDELTPGARLNAFRSLECQIMDWADDTAYSLYDIIDGVHARFIDISRLEFWGSSQTLSSLEQALLESMISHIRARKLSRVFARRVGEFITASRLRERSNFMSGVTNRYRFELEINQDLRTESNLYKRIASDIVFDSPQLRQLRHKWDHILSRIYDALAQNYALSPDPQHKLVSEEAHWQILALDSESERMRCVCDHIAGMTDGFAIRTYKRLFDPGYGSFVDLI